MTRALVLASLFACSPNDSDTGKAPGTDDSANTDTGPTDTGTDVDARLVEPGIWTLDGLERTLPADDLAPLVSSIGDASWVGLGESVHTTGGQHALRVRVVEELVQNDGFRSITLETPWEDALLVTDYVATGTGTASDALKSGIFGVFQSVEMLELVEWLRAWNVKHPDDPVAFWGWDIQQGWDDGRLLDAFFHEWAPAQADSIYAGIDSCQAVGMKDAFEYYTSDEWLAVADGAGDPKVHAACEAGIAAVQDWLTKHGGEVQADALARAWISVIGLAAWEEETWTFVSDIVESYEVRDRANAEVIQRIHDLDWPGTKTIVWAHDAHVAKAHSTWHGYDDVVAPYGWQGWTSMGEVLTAALGDDYRAISTNSYTTRINWPGVGSIQPAPTANEAIEVQLYARKLAYAYVDLLDPDVAFSADREWQLNHEWSTLQESYDGVLYMQVSEAMEYIE